MVQEIRKQFAKRLRDLRRQYGWTQEELAERANLAYRHVQRLESMKNPPPAKIDTLQKIAQAFRISLSRLLQLSVRYPSRSSTSSAVADANLSKQRRKTKR